MPRRAAGLSPSAPAANQPNEDVPTPGRVAMPRSSLEDRLSSQVRTMQVVFAAMVVVPLVFAGVVYAIGSQAPQNPAPLRGQVVGWTGGPVVERIALVAGLAAVALAPSLGGVVTRMARSNLVRQGLDEPERRSEAHLTGLVVTGATNEMAAFVNLIAYMATQSPWAMGMGLLLIASNAARFPTMRRAVAWAGGGG